MTDVADILQTYARGINRPETDQIGYGVATDDQRNFEYFRLYGTTAQRPASAPTGWHYYDTTVAIPLVFDGVDWVEIASGGGGLTAPTDPGDDGKLAVADGGDILWTDPGAVNVGSADTALEAATALAVTISGPTDIGFGSVPDGQLLIRSGANFVGVAASTLSVASAVTASAATSAASADYALGLTFGVNDLDTGTVPTTHQLIYYNGSALTGIDPGNLLRRKTSSNTSTAAIVFSANALWVWNGSTTVSLTANFTGAVDGAEITILFPAGSMNSFALSADIDPTGLVASTFTSNLKAYLLRLKYHAAGPCIEVVNFLEVTDQP